MDTKDYGRGRGSKNRIAKARRNAEWRAALAEGRVIRVTTQRFMNGSLVPEYALTSYPTVTAAQVALEAAQDAGFNAEVVR